MPVPEVDFFEDLKWLRHFAPATRASAAALPVLRDERLLVVCHLDIKMVPYFEALLSAGAEVHACAANPATTRDEVAEYLRSLGVEVPAHKSDPPGLHEAHLRAAIEAGPTLLSEMGADASAATGGRLGSVRGGLEATGTGVGRLRDLDLAYPVFDWDSVPIKQGLHNRHLVGLMAANTFLNVTGLSLYGKRVLVVGYGPVGRGGRGWRKILRRRRRGLRSRPRRPPLRGLSRLPDPKPRGGPPPRRRSLYRHRPRRGRPRRGASSLQKRCLPRKPRPHNRRAARRSSAPGSRGEPAPARRALRLWRQDPLPARGWRDVEPRGRPRRPLRHLRPRHRARAGGYRLSRHRGRRVPAGHPPATQKGSGPRSPPPPEARCLRPTEAAS